MRSVPDGTHLTENTATLALRPTAFVVHGPRSSALLCADLTTTVHTAVQTVTVMDQCANLGLTVETRRNCMSHTATVL